MERKKEGGGRVSGGGRQAKRQEGCKEVKIASNEGRRSIRETRQRREKEARRGKG